MRWVRHVALIRQMTSAYDILVKNLKEKDHIGDVSIAERLLLKRFSRNMVRGCGLYSSGSRWASAAGC
jgi:hypothetical protein